jgi:hypothetical protein
MMLDFLALQILSKNIIKNAFKNHPTKSKLSAPAPPSDEGEFLAISDSMASLVHWPNLVDVNGSQTPT